MTLTRRATAFLASGLLQRDKDAEVIHVLVDKLKDLTPELSDVNSQSRDFR